MKETTIIKQELNRYELLSLKPFEEAKRYWTAKLAGEPPGMELPEDTLARLQEEAKASLSFKWDSAVSQTLLAAGRRQPLSIYVLLLTAFKIVLARYTGQEDILILSPVYSEDEQAYNHAVALRDEVHGTMTFRELAGRVKQTVADGYRHQHYPLDALSESLAPAHPDAWYRTALSLDPLHGAEAALNIASRPENRFTLRFHLEGERLGGTAHYDAKRFLPDTTAAIVDCLSQVLTQVLANPDREIDMLDWVPLQDLDRLFGGGEASQAASYPAGKTIHACFEEQAERTPDRTAVVCGEQSMTYRELNRYANRIAAFLREKAGVEAEVPVGILLERSIDMIAAALGVLKAGGGYVPLDPAYPEERLQMMVEDARIPVVISMGSHIKLLNRLQWACSDLHSFLCLDVEEVHLAVEEENNELMNGKLWEHIGSQAEDDITGGAWTNSYTGEAFSRDEMDEYGENIWTKLRPHLHAGARVLEIGCATGLSMYRIAPHVHTYVGTDLSSVIIEKNDERVQREGIENIFLHCLAADEIDRLDGMEFDIIIMNSVIQCFHGHNYLRRVMDKALKLLKDQGLIFIGDVMDQDVKPALVQSMLDYRSAYPGSRAKTDWSEELFVSRLFWEDLRSDFPSIREVNTSAKIGSIVNELTLFRYDTMLTVDKRTAHAHAGPLRGKHKKQYGCSSLRDGSEENSPSAAGPRSLAYVIYTSGTTGRPKGVMIEHRNVVRLLLNDRMPFAFDERDVWTMFHSFSFDFSVWEMYGALLHGGKLVIVPKRTAQDTRAFAELLHRSGVTVLNQTPTAFYQLIAQVQASGVPLPELRYVIFGGEALKPSLLQPWKDMYPVVRLVNMYGITETTVHVSFMEVTDHDMAANSTRIGRPIPTLSAYVMDSKLRLLPPGAVGELCIGGDGVARGYLNREELTAEKFVPNPYKAGEMLYRSGDLARMRPDGTLEYAGRIDQQVKVRGYRIELGEIESRLCLHEAVREAAVATMEDADGDKTLCAYYVPSGTVSRSELRDFLEARLPAHMVPTHFTELEALPVTPNGKLDRAALLRPGLIPSTGVYAAPRDDMEQVIARIWEELLGVEHMGIHDNFFELGAHSITMMKAIGRMEQQLQVELAFSELIENPTTGQLASCVAGKERRNHRDAGKYPLRLPEPGAMYAPFPLTEVQTAYMAGRNAEYEMGGISTHFYVEIATGMDMERFNRSLNLVIRRHPMLRAIIMPHGEQRILEHVPEYRIRTEDISGLQEDMQEAVLLQERERMSHDVHAPEVWPLFEFTAYRLSAGQHLLLVGFDVLIADAANLRQISRELLHYYHHPEEPLPQLEFTFRDYIMAYKQLQQSPVYHRDREFWLSNLEDFPPAPALPMKPKQPGSRGFKPQFTRLSREFSTAEWEALKQAAREKSVTPSAMLCTVYAEILAHWSNQPQLAVNMTVFNRYPFHPDVHHIVGDFTSILLLDLKLDPAYPFWEQAVGVQHTLMEALEHRHFDGIEMIREIARHHSYPPGKAVMPFVFTSVIFDEGDAGGESWADLGEMTYGISQTSQVYLDFQAIETDGRLLLNWDYAMDVLDAGMVEFMFGQYLARLSGLVDGEPELPAGMLLPEADARLLQAYNATDFPGGEPRTLQQLFIERARPNPERTAVVEEDRDWSYGELEELSNRLAGYLTGRGIGRGDRVALLASREAVSIILALGILKTGAAYVPVDPGYPQERRDYIIASSACRELLEPQVLEAAAAYPASFETAYHPEDPAYILFTSGSTGRPKGVVITHQAVCSTIKDINRRFSVNENDRILALSSMCFDLSVYDLFGAFHVGAAAVLVRDPSDLAEVAKTLYEKRITIWNSVPALMELVTEYLEAGSKMLQHTYGDNSAWNPQDAMQLTDQQVLLHTLEGGLKERPGISGERKEARQIHVDAGEALHSLRLVLLSGDWISLGLPDKISRHFPQARAISLGGATEASIWSIAYPIESPGEGWRSIPYGMPLANQTIHVLNYRMQPCPVDVPGELYIGGQGLAQGYWQDEDKTGRAFIQHPELGRLYRTGDHGVMRREGYVEFLGRRDQQVKIRGYRVEPGEIEACLLRHPAIRQALVVDRTDALNRKSLCAYIVPFDSATAPAPDAAVIWEFLGVHLPSYMVPDHLVFLNAIPLTPNGKVDRAALPAPDAEPERQVPYSAPDNEIEQKLAEIWQDLLQTGAVGRDDDFFTLGGTSLHTMSLIARVHEHFGVELPLQQLFTAPTIMELSDYLFRVLAGDDSLTLAADAFAQLSAGTKGNLFVFPPVGGYGIVYKALAPLLPEYAMFSFNYLEDKDLIERYAEQVERIQPQGRIITMGYSSGGTLAYEVAKTLIRRGREVSDVILLDSARRVQPAYFSEAKLQERAEETMAHIEQDPQFRDYLTNAFVKRVILRRIKSYLSYFFNELVSSGPIEAHIHMIEASDTNREATGPWAEASGRTFQVYGGHGGHAHMLSPDYAAANAEIVRTILRRFADE